MSLPVTEKDNLYFLYIICNLSKEDLSKIYNKKPRTIQKKLSLYNIYKPKILHDFNTKKSVFLKYGTDNVFKLNAVKEKIKDTNLKRYGLTHFNKTKEYKDKVQKTNLNKYGTKWVLQNKHIQEKIKQTNLKKYNTENVFSSVQIQEKIKDTNLKRYGAKNPQQVSSIKEKTKQTLLKRYNSETTFTSQKIKEKTKQTLLQKYNVDNVSKNKEIINKIYTTRKENHTLNTSKYEEKIKNILFTRFPHIKYQYKSEKYPFNCDFYIPELDLYIEYQGHWSHGKHPFNSSKEDLLLLSIWESKNTKYYQNAIKTWTIRDPLKRKIANKNKLNWLEFFNFDEFITWFKTI